MEAEDHMGVCVIRRRVGRALVKSGLPSLDYTLNPYTGCSHGCIYCYARLYCNPEIGNNWGKIVVVKENIVEVLRREVRKSKKGRVGLSTITDPYQHIEKKEELSRRILQILLKSGFHVSIQTKNELVLRDTDLLASHTDSVDVGFTITTLDDSLARTIEPNASPPRNRVKALEKLHSEGIRTWVFLGPIIPGTEDDIDDIVEVAKVTESVLYYDKYRIKTFMKSGLEKELAERAKKIDWKSIADKIKGMYDRAFFAFSE